MAKFTLYSSDSFGVDLWAPRFSFTTYPSISITFERIWLDGLGAGVITSFLGNGIVVGGAVSQPPVVLSGTITGLVERYPGEVQMRASELNISAAELYVAGKNRDIDALNGLLFGQADTVFGSIGGDTIRSLAGADVIQAGRGQDVVNGGEGRDKLFGGLGADRFEFDTVGSANRDTIGDFMSGTDKIFLDDDVFANLPSGAINVTPFIALEVTAFRVGSAATDADDRIVYERSTGKLFYDADGAGGASKILFAQVTAGLKLVASDFSIID